MDLIARFPAACFLTLCAAASAVAPASPGFSSKISPVDAALAARMSGPGGTWHEGCPVPLADLRHVSVSYHGTDGLSHDGELVVAADVAEAVVRVMQHLYEGRFPIARMSLVEEFGGSDEASMEANNTSGFNCRMGGSDGWSQHAWGHAVDINPVVNPMVGTTRVRPAAGQAFLDRTRTDAPGMITTGSLPVREFYAVGWHWGGNWRSSKDFQHFSVSGR